MVHFLGGKFYLLPGLRLVSQYLVLHMSLCSSVCHGVHCPPVMQSLLKDATKSSIHELMSSQLDYCNSVVYTHSEGMYCRVDLRLSTVLFKTLNGTCHINASSTSYQSSSDTFHRPQSDKLVAVARPLMRITLPASVHSVDKFALESVI